jgi:hypothetical protein
LPVGSWLLLLLLILLLLLLLLLLRLLHTSDRSTVPERRQEEWGEAIKINWSRRRPSFQNTAAGGQQNPPSPGQTKPTHSHAMPACLSDGPSLAPLALLPRPVAAQ